MKKGAYCRGSESPSPRPRRRTVLWSPSKTMGPASSRSRSPRFSPSCFTVLSFTVSRCPGGNRASAYRQRGCMASSLRANPLPSRQRPLATSLRITTSSRSTPRRTSRVSLQTRSLSGRLHGARRLRSSWRPSSKRDASRWKSISSRQLSPTLTYPLSL